MWAEELEKWLPHLRPSQVHVIESRTDRLTALPQQQAERADNAGACGRAADGTAADEVPEAHAGGAMRPALQLGTDGPQAAALGERSAPAMAQHARATDAVMLPSVTITSYEMLKRLSCLACQKGAALAEQPAWMGPARAADAGQLQAPNGRARQQQQQQGAGASAVGSCLGPGERWVIGPLIMRQGIQP